MRFFTSPGSTERPVFTSCVAPDGSLIVEQTGIEDIQSHIQAYEDMTDINKIVQRFQAGDVSVVNAHEMVYADMTSLPRNYHDYAQMMVKGKAAFDSLSPEVRDGYGNDFGKFLDSSFDSLVSKLSNISNKEVITEKTQIEVSEPTKID